MSEVSLPANPVRRIMHIKELLDRNTKLKTQLLHVAKRSSDEQRAAKHNRTVGSNYLTLEPWVCLYVRGHVKSSVTEQL